MRKPKLLSWSRIERFIKCEEDYLRHYVLNEREDTPESEFNFTIGGIYHKAMEAVVSAIEWKEALWPGIQDAIMEQEEVLERLKIHPGKLAEEIEERITKIQELWKIGCGGLIPSAQEVGGVRTVDSEMEFEDFERGYKGFIDLKTENFPKTGPTGGLQGYHDEPGVIDFKVVMGNKKRTQRDAEKSGQLALYALQTGVKKAGFFEIPRNMKKPVRIATATYTEADLARWADWFERMWWAVMTREVQWKEQIDAGLPPTACPSDPKSGLCCPKWCTRSDTCIWGAK